MSKYKVGDKVRILHTDYHGSGLTVGSVHEVAEVGNGYVKLPYFLPSGDALNLAFHDHEIEPYTEDNTAKIARLVRELNSALAESKDNLVVDVEDVGIFRGKPIITVTKKERIA